MHVCETQTPDNITSSTSNSTAPTPKKATSNKTGGPGIFLQLAGEYVAVSTLPASASSMKTQVVQGIVCVFHSRKPLCIMTLQRKSVGPVMSKRYYIAGEYVAVSTLPASASSMKTQVVQGTVCVFQSRKPLCIMTLQRKSVGPVMS